MPVPDFSPTGFQNIFEHGFGSFLINCSRDIFEQGFRVISIQEFRGIWNSFCDGGLGKQIGSAYECLGNQIKKVEAEQPCQEPFKKKDGTDTLNNVKAKLRCNKPILSENALCVATPTLPNHWQSKLGDRGKPNLGSRNKLQVLKMHGSIGRTKAM